MKKFVFALLAFCLFPLFAELYPSRRYVEIGNNVNFLASENVMPLTEIFRKNLIIDLKKIHSNMSKDGATVAASVNEDFYLDFNFDKFGMGLHVGSDLTMNFNIGKDLFKVLDCVAPGTVYNGEVFVWAESFATISAPVRFNVHKWRIKITPTYFVPAFYVPATTARGYAINGLDGSITVKAEAPFSFYTISEFKGLIKDGEFSTDFVNHIDSGSLMSDIATSGGVDLSASVEYPILSSLDLGGYIRTPILPGHLRHKVSAVATASVQTDSLMQIFFDDKEFDTNVELSDAVYSNCDYIVNRPLRFGAECAWRPVGKWLTLRGMLGAALRNPFGEDVSTKSFYPEYKLGVEVVGIGMFGLNLSSQYTKKIFAHGMDIMLNFRVIEFDFSVALCSSNFVQSFRGEGVAAGFGLKFGW